jgi:glutathione S-transferase
MITLYGFGESFGVIDASPFVVKVDTFMKMVDIPYERIVNSKNLGKSPKGKLPFITDNNEGVAEIVADSQAIIEYLTQKYQITLDEHLSPEETAQAYLLTKSLDENLYWCLVYSRWIVEESWQIAKKEFFGFLPVPLRLFVPSLIRKRVKKNLHAQGMGRHSKNEILAISDKSFSALSTLLGDKSYFFGDKPSSFDATAYSILCQFITANCDNEFNAKANNYQNLVEYCQRIEHTYYS